MRFCGHPWIDVQTGVKYGNPADCQVEKSGSPPSILGVRMPGPDSHLFHTLPLGIFIVSGTNCEVSSSILNLDWALFLRACHPMRMVIL